MKKVKVKTSTYDVGQGAGQNVIQGRAAAAPFCVRTDGHARVQKGEDLRVGLCLRQRLHSLHSVFSALSSKMFMCPAFAKRYLKATSKSKEPASSRAQRGGT